MNGWKENGKIKHQENLGLRIGTWGVGLWGLMWAEISFDLFSAQLSRSLEFHCHVATESSKSELDSGRRVNTKIQIHEWPHIRHTRCTMKFTNVGFHCIDPKCHIGFMICVDWIETSWSPKMLPWILGFLCLTSLSHIWQALEGVKVIGHLKSSPSTISKK